MVNQAGGVVQPHLQGGDLRALLRLHDARDLQRFPVVHQAPHVGVVAGLVLPHAVFVIALVEIGGVHQLEGDAHQVVVGKRQAIARRIDGLLVGEGAHHALELGAIAQAHGIEHEIAHAAARGEHQHNLVVVLWPMTGHNVVLALDHAHVVGQLVEDVGAHHRRHDAVRSCGGAQTDAGERLVRVHLMRAARRVGAEDLRRDVIAILDGTHVRLHARFARVEILFQRRKIIAADAIERARDHLRFVHGLVRIAIGGVVLRLLRRRAFRAAAKPHHACHVEPLVLDLQRVFGKRLLLHIGDVAVHAVGQRQDGGNADDADAARERRHERAALLREQILKRQGERREERHAGATCLLGGAARAVLGRRVERAGVVADDAVSQGDDARSVALRQLGVVRDHDDQAVVRNLSEQVHDLHAGLGVERARRLVGQQNLGVVDERTSDGDALHLAAGELAGLFAHVLGKPHAAERLDGALPTLGAGHAGKCEGQLDVFQDGLVRDKVVGLEHEADAVVAVRVPIAVLVLACGHTVDEQVSVVVMVKAADDVEHGGLARARRPQHRHELVVAKGHRHMVERGLREVRSGVGLAHVYQLQHAAAFRI